MRTLALILLLALPAFAAEPIEWGARQYGSRNEAGTIVISRIPDHFWAYLEHHHKFPKAKWDAEVEEQQQRLRHDARTGASAKAHAKYLETRKKLEAAMAAGATPGKELDAAVEAVRGDFGPALADPLLKLRDQARAAALKKKSEPRSKEMDAKGKALEGASLDGKGEKLDAAFENSAGARALAGKGAAGSHALIGSSGAKGGQLADGAANSAASRYGDARKGTLDKLVQQDLAAAEIKAPVKKLPVADLRKRGYSDENIRDLDKVIQAGSSGAAPVASDGTYWSKKMGGSGTAANIENSFSMMWGDTSLKNGCVNYQRKTLDAIPNDGSIEAKPVMIGKGMEHHAVVAFPKPPEDVRKDPVKYEAWWKEKGVVLDGWKKQTSDPETMTYGSVDAWRKDFLAYRFMGPRLEEP